MMDDTDIMVTVDVVAYIGGSELLLICDPKTKAWGVFIA